MKGSGCTSRKFDNYYMCFLILKLYRLLFWWCFICKPHDPAISFSSYYLIFKQREHYNYTYYQWFLVSNYRWIMPYLEKDIQDRAVVLLFKIKNVGKVDIKYNEYDWRLNKLGVTPIILWWTKDTPTLVKLRAVHC